MFLKRVVMHGFKSFADRTEFDFGPGMTSIVGPNGCGKSNVLDAVRWVLGEQSAKTLRGTKMLDVVFNGSRSRKPANFAEVHLVFDNSSGLLPTDEKEVLVERLLYRSGESEYRLNGKPSRLKDIRELLLDTGVGVDAYSIIEQGKVDALLQANPVERREIFEEAAGISRYKMRRTEAQRKLERSQQNLLRLNDLLDELEKRLRSVKLQAGKARNFLEYDARLRQLRCEFSLSEYDTLQKQRNVRSTLRQELTELVTAKRADLATRDADAAELDHKVQQIDEEIRRIEAALASLSSEVSTLEERGAQGRRLVGELGDSRQRQLMRAADLVGQIESLEQRLVGVAQELEGTQAAEAEHRSAVSALSERRTSADRDFAAARQAVTNEQRAAFEAARRVTLLHNEQQNIEEQRKRLVAGEERLAARGNEIETLGDAVRRRREENDTRAAEIDVRLNELRGLVQQSDMRLNELTTEAKLSREHIGAAKEERSAVASRLRLLEDMESRLEGVDAGTREVLGWRGGETDGGVLGIVADVLQIDDSRVSLLQSVLARFENHVLVRESHAFLAELERRGQPASRVNAIALDRVSEQQLPAQFDGAPGVLANVIDWVRCEPEFRPLAQRLLGRVILVDSFLRALALADGAPEGCIFVTPEGATVDVGGNITVGRAKDLPGLMSRKFEVRQLRAELDELETRVERLQREHTAIEARTADEQLQRGARLEEIASQQRQHSTVILERTRADDENSRLARESAALRTESASIRLGLADLAERANRIAGEITAGEQQQRTHNERLDELSAAQQAAEQLAAGLVAELSAAQVELGRAAERRRAHEQVLSDLQHRVRQLRGEHAGAERDAEAALERIQSVEREIEAAAQRTAELVEQIGATEAEALAQREQRQFLRRSFEACGAAARQIHAEIEETETLLRDTEIALREIEVRADGLMARVREELSLELVDLYRSFEAAERDWDAVRAEIDELRGKIARLGNVNLDAIQELEEITPRYDNMVAQKADLVSSIERLQALITELDDESRARFVKCYEEVRTNFQELFRKLFGGGKADIVLEDPERPLECGIEVIARPPGKEPQSLSLLSGGEKTMTTVALLFSIFQRKPSPFTILDEVDAALDESNIGRFNTLLQEFLSCSQFIVITHNKRTMQCADVLYGVTMQEPGVSRRVSVRFDDRVETPIVA